MGIWRHFAASPLPFLAPLLDEAPAEPPLWVVAARGHDEGLWLGMGPNECLGAQIHGETSNLQGSRLPYHAPRFDQAAAVPTLWVVDARGQDEGTKLGMGPNECLGA
jgi:hypothetical protein